MNKTPKLRFKEFSGDWESKKLGTICDVTMGQSPSSSCYNERNIGLPLIQGNADVQGRKTAPRIYTSDITKTCNIGDIIMSVRAPVGAISKSIHDACIGRGVCSIKPKQSNEFIYQFLIKYEDKWSRISQGSTFESVNRTDITDTKVSIPSKEEQEKIASFFSLIDDKIYLQGEKVEALKDYKKGMMQKIFSRELRFKDDDGRDYPAWEEKKLGDLGKFYRGHSYNAGDVNEDGLLVLRSNNIQDNTITFDTDLQFVRKQCKDEIKLREKDIVICMANGSRNLVGKSGEFNNSNGYNDLTVGAFCSIYRTKNPLGKYLLQIELYYKYLDILLSGTNINNLKNSQLEELQFNIPTSNEETEKIVKILSDIDLKIKKEQEKLYYLNEYKKGLLQHMFV
ncbi:restriction endonuclease subunit S [Asaccharospora irregularis]|uniref:Type I restriction enzyme, S subunit n=1 Tax=Asaccharospora irregularis DSM 2635 TaxID=1121321 RepID=A0A1M5J742_9FIRM|nr:restriction endonuclease subunit S [Asaccharospora irregularis]SHG35833.1 type I restriction enzyme, S subunit [Asaccharospora irregularis DSM 2635]